MSHIEIDTHAVFTLPLKAHQQKSISFYTIKLNLQKFLDKRLFKDQARVIKSRH